jgi:hypothetical protein
MFAWSQLDVSAIPVSKYLLSLSQADKLGKMYTVREEFKMYMKGKDISK